jgi:hypothetical protein
MMPPPKWLSFRNAIIIAITLAVVIFLLFSKEYFGRLDLFANIMSVNLYLGITFPYRWFLAGLVILVAVAAIWDSSKNSN